MDLVEYVYRQACQRQRSHELEDIVVTIDIGRWKMMPVIQGMRTWVREMSATKFASGSVLDKFVWTYSLYMTAGYADIGMKAWLNKALHDTGEWLRDSM